MTWRGPLEWETVQVLQTIRVRGPAPLPHAPPGFTSMRTGSRRDGEQGCRVAAVVGSLSCSLAWRGEQAGWPGQTKQCTARLGGRARGAWYGMENTAAEGMRLLAGGSPACASVSRPPGCGSLHAGVVTAEKITVSAVNP